MKRRRRSRSLRRERRERKQRKRMRRESKQRKRMRRERKQRKRMRRERKQRKRMKRERKQRKRMRKRERRNSARTSSRMPEPQTMLINTFYIICNSILICRDASDPLQPFQAPVRVWSVCPKDLTKSVGRTDKDGQSLKDWARRTNS